MLQNEIAQILKNVYNTENGIDVFIQDQTSPIAQYFLINEQKTDISLTSDVAIDDTVISVSAGHGFTGAAGEFLCLYEGENFVQMAVKSVSVNDITIDHPITSVYTAAGAQVVRGNNLLNVDGSSTPVTFQMNLRTLTIPVDISKVIITMFHSTAGDDGKFGGIAALTNGVYFRKENSIIYNLNNYKNNQDFKNIGGIVSYTSKGPSGIEATDMVFNIKDTYGQVIRINAAENDIFKCVIRDDLTSLSSFIVSLIGSYTEGE